MNNTSLSFYSSVFGLVVGGISLLSLVVAVCRPHLPSNKIKTLETLLLETEDTFRKAVEAGLLVHEFIERAEDRLTGLKERECGLRARAYNATTLWKDYVEFFDGTSTAIGRACQSVKNLRAEVITSSEERRRSLLLIDSDPQVPLRALPALPPIQNAGPSPNSSPSTEIPRPRSCPPTLPAWSSADTPKVPVERNPFGDPSRNDSDIWTADFQM